MIAEEARKYAKLIEQPIEHLQKLSTKKQKKNYDTDQTVKNDYAGSDFKKIVDIKDFYDYYGFNLNEQH